MCYNVEEEGEKYMRRLDNKETQNGDNKVLKRASLAVFIIILILFAAIIFITEITERFFGKTAGTVVLIIIAAVIAIILYRKEIVAFLKKNRS